MMKTKTFALLSLSILALVMIAGLGSAAITVSDLDTLDKFGNPQTFTISNDGVGDVNITLATQTIEDSDGNTVSVKFNQTNITVGAADSEEVEAYIDTSTLDEDFFYGTYTYSYVIEEQLHPENNDTLILKFENTPLDASKIDDSTNDDLKLKIKDISVVSGFGKDTDWYPFDEVEVEIEVKNDNDDYKMKDIAVSWGLYNTKTGDWYVDDEESEFNLKSNDEKTLTVAFKLDEDIDELVEGDYVFYVWANAVLDTDSGEVNIGASVSENEVSVADENDFVILDNIQVVEKASCGSQVQITAEVWNIGNDDQTDVSVVIQSEELGITKIVEVGDIDAFDNQKIDVIVNIPQDAEEKSYLFTLKVFDEYGEVFENDNDDKAQFPVYLKVEGNCTSEPKATVSASLESEAKAGQDLIVKVTVKNTGTQTSTFEISLADYSDWATFVSVVPESVTLGAGESEDILVTLKINSDASGSKNFNVLITQGTKVLTQPISIMVEKGGLGGLFTGGVISEGNWPIWTIGAINVILFFVIILVALKVARKQ